MSCFCKYFSQIVEALAMQRCLHNIYILRYKIIAMQTFFSLFICVNILYIQVTEATVNYTFPFSLESRTSKNFIMFTGFTLQTSYIFVYIYVVFINSISSSQKLWPMQLLLQLLIIHVVIFHFVH